MTALGWLQRRFASGQKTLGRFRRTWVEISFPLFLAVFMFAPISWVVFTGEKDQSLAGRAEYELVRHVLSWRGPRRIDASPFVIIDVRLEDLALSEESEVDSESVREPSFRAFKSAINRLQNWPFNHLYIDWVDQLSIRAHPSDFLEWYEGLGSMAERMDLVVPYPKMKLFLPEVLEQVKPLTSYYCDFLLQTMCDYVEHMKHWLHIRLIDSYVGDKQTLTDLQIISRNLPGNWPVYMLHFNDPNAFPRYSLGEILDPSFDPQTFAGKTIFLGRDQPLREASKTVRLGMPYDFGKTELLRHDYFALLSQMWLDRAYIRIPSERVTHATAAVLSLGLLIAILQTKTLFSIVYLLAVFLAFPLGSVWLLAHMQVYLPFFPVLYAVGTTALGAVFIRMSMEVFLKKRGEVLQAEKQELAHIKGNFLSLVSHNLNTPVAKMQGMFDLLLQSIDSSLADRRKQELRTRLEESLSTIAEMQLLTRVVLILARLDDDLLQTQSVRLRDLQTDLRNSTLPMLKRLGLSIDLEFSEEALYDHNTVNMDVRFFSAGLGVMLLLLSEWRWEPNKARKSGVLSEFKSELSLKLACASVDHIDGPNATGSLRLDIDAEWACDSRANDCDLGPSSLSVVERWQGLCAELKGKTGVTARKTWEGAEQRTRLLERYGRSASFLQLVVAFAERHQVKVQKIKEKSKTLIVINKLDL